MVKCMIHFGVVAAETREWKAIHDVRNDSQSGNKLRKRVLDARAGCALSRPVVSWPHVGGVTRFPLETIDRN